MTDEFSADAEGLGYNDAALMDLLNYALDEPINWRKMRGLDHLIFVGFVIYVPNLFHLLKKLQSPSGGQEVCSTPRGGR